MKAMQTFTNGFGDVLFWMAVDGHPKTVEAFGNIYTRTKDKFGTVYQLVKEG